jgi:hypothetical protein
MEEIIKKWFDSFKPEEMIKKFFDSFKPMEESEEDTNEIIKKWFDSFKPMEVGDSNFYNRFLYLEQIERDVIYFFKENVQIEEEKITNLLSLVNKYSYYLKRNDTREESPKLQDNKKKLNKLIELLDDDFMNYLHEYIDFDKTLIISKDSIEIKKFDGIKGYLNYDFRWALKALKRFNDSNQIAVNELSITQRSGCLFLRPDTTAYKQKLSKRAILKGLHFELLLETKITKKQSIDIIMYFFDETLQEKKPEHTFSTKLVKLLHECTRSELLAERHTANYATLDGTPLPEHIKEINDIFNLIDTLKEKDPILWTPTL